MERALRDSMWVITKGKSRAEVAKAATEKGMLCFGWAIDLSDHFHINVGFRHNNLWNHQCFFSYREEGVR